MNLPGATEIDRSNQPQCLGAVPTVLGFAAVAFSPAGLRRLWLFDTEGDARRSFETHPLKPVLPTTPASAEALLDLAARIDACWNDPAHVEPPPLDPIGSEFQRRVWAALRAVPAGHTITYGGIARRLGLSDESARAVGLACGANPIALFIPCHRAVRADGTLGGFRWGLDVKRRLLERERLAVGAVLFA